MYDLISQSNTIIQGLIAIIIIGMFYSLWHSTHLYGGIIGKAVRYLGLGTMFITVAILEHLLITFSIIQNDPQIAIAQEIFNLLGLVFLGLGFSTLVQATKA
jgi:hypothetical protein